VVIYLHDIPSNTSKASLETAAGLLQADATSVQDLYWRGMGVGGVLAAVGVAVEDERAVVEEAGVGELQPRASCRPRLKPAQLCTPAPWSGHRAPSDDDEDDAPGSPVAALLKTHGGNAAREAEADDDDADATDDARDAEHVSEADASLDSKVKSSLMKNATKWVRCATADSSR
jgi:hypothetical protein